MDPNSINMVIYHANCSDGFGGAFAAWKKLGDNAVYIPGVYGEAAPDVKGKNVVCIDFSYDNETTKRLIKEANSFLILDHHKSAMIDLCDIPEARFDLSKSGAILAWEFFHPGVEAPKFLKYIQDRDLWKWEMPYSREFSAAFDAISFDFDDYDSHCADSVFDESVERGSHILAHMRTAINKLVSKAEKRILLNRKAIVLNAANWISEIGDQLGKKADVAVIWYYSHQSKDFRVSLRSTKEDVDVSEIARHFGGGGHKGAAGFVYKGENIESIFTE